MSKKSKKEQETQQDPSSQSRQSDETPDTGGDSGVGPEESGEGAIEQSAKVAEGDGVEKNPDVEDVDDEDAEDTDSAPVAEFEVPDDYNPFNDPLVPSSDVAQTVVTELRGTGKSKTLQALHEGHKRDSE